jgi:hypothetical protein
MKSNGIKAGKKAGNSRKLQRAQHEQKATDQQETPSTGRDKSDV